jgi:hypothetical protein
MILRHATTTARAARIREEGFRVAQADPAAKIKGCWFHSKSNSPWGVLHTIRKHGAALEEVVVLEVRIPRRQLTRFRTGLWFTTQDVPASAICGEYAGSAFSASASE